MTGVDVQYNEERNQVEYMFLDEKTDSRKYWKGFGNL